MNKIIQLGLVGLSAIALTACGGDNNDGITEVTFSDLTSTGVDGYKINVTIDDGDESIFDDITYYFCSGALGPGPDYEDYAAVSGELTGEEPDFDHGKLNEDLTALDFYSDSENIPVNGYTVYSDNGILEEGQTYDFMWWDDVPTGSVHINSISPFDCNSVPIPVG